MVKRISVTFCSPRVKLLHSTTMEQSLWVKHIISNDMLTFSPTTTRCLQIVYVINNFDIHASYGQFILDECIYENIFGESPDMDEYDDEVSPVRVMGETRGQRRVVWMPIHLKDFKR